MKNLKIEWKHLDVDGETCVRCSDTGETLAQVVEDLSKKLAPKGIKVEYIETKLDDTQIPQSNIILFNGAPIEKVLDIAVSKNYCESCTSLLGKDTYCRTVEYEGTVFEDIPGKAIRQAAFKTLGLKDDQETAECSSGCSCGCK